MKLIMCAGPPTSGKTTVLRQVARRLLKKGRRLAYLKIDVQFADEDELFRNEFSIPAKKFIPATCARIMPACWCWGTR